jgi:hypothetical protein
VVLEEFGVSACVYVSYSAGDSRSHRGPWYGRLNKMFGVRHCICGSFLLVAILSC